jgi:hypothetical protein
MNAKFSGATSRGLADLSVKTADDLALFVCSEIFPDRTWPPGPGADSWQYDAWNDALHRFADRANAYAFGPAGDQDSILKGITFWISGKRNLQGCMPGLSWGTDPVVQLGGSGTNQPELSEEEVLICAARTTFPRDAWPPAPTSPGWQWHAWQKFKVLLSDMLR